MTDFETWFVDFEPILAKLASGLDLFGVHAAWLWAIPACWAVTLMLLWIYTSWRQRQRAIEPTSPMRHEICRCSAASPGSVQTKWPSPVGPIVSSGVTTSFDSPYP